MLEEHNFGYQVKDSEDGDYYGTKEGYPILEFTPCNLKESKGAERSRAGLIIARVFKLKKHRQWCEKNGKRETTYSFSETRRNVFAIHMKGSYWDEVPPPDAKLRSLENYYSTPRHFVQDERCIKCVYDYICPKKMWNIIAKYQAGTFTKWKRFRGTGFKRTYLTSAKR